MFWSCLFTVNGFLNLNKADHSLLKEGAIYLWGLRNLWLSGSMGCWQLSCVGKWILKSDGHLPNQSWIVNVHFPIQRLASRNPSLLPPGALSQGPGVPGSKPHRLRLREVKQGLGPKEIWGRTHSPSSMKGGSKWPQVIYDTRAEVKMTEPWNLFCALPTMPEGCVCVRESVCTCTLSSRYRSHLHMICLSGSLFYLINNFFNLHIIMSYDNIKHWLQMHLKCAIFFLDWLIQGCV